MQLCQPKPQQENLIEKPQADKSLWFNSFRLRCFKLTTETNCRTGREYLDVVICFGPCGKFKNCIDKLEL